MRIWQELPGWIEAFTQMGPDAAFESYNTGSFYSEDLASLLRTIAKQGAYFFEEKKLEDGTVFQKVKYGR